MDTGPAYKAGSEVLDGEDDEADGSYTTRQKIRDATSRCKIFLVYFPCEVHLI